MELNQGDAVKTDAAVEALSSTTTLSFSLSANAFLLAGEKGLRLFAFIKRHGTLFQSISQPPINSFHNKELWVGIT
jgi:hypothetical protein